MKYFVKELPESCSLCDCCHTKPYDIRYRIDGEKFCGILNEDVEVYYYYGDGRPQFCPLSEIPSKGKEFIEVFNNNVVSDEFLESCKTAAKLFKKEGSNEKSN